MGIKLIVEVLDFAPPILTSRERLVLLVLAEDSPDGAPKERDDNGHEKRINWSPIGNPVMLHRAGLNRSQFFATLQALMAAGCLGRAVRGGGGHRAKYRILDLRLGKSDPGPASAASREIGPRPRPASGNLGRSSGPTASREIGPTASREIGPTASREIGPLPLIDPSETPTSPAGVGLRSSGDHQVAPSGNPAPPEPRTARTTDTSQDQQIRRHLQASATTSVVGGDRANGGAPVPTDQDRGEGDERQELDRRLAELIRQHPGAEGQAP